MSATGQPFIGERPHRTLSSGASSCTLPKKRTAVRAVNSKPCRLLAKEAEASKVRRSEVRVQQVLDISSLVGDGRTNDLLPVVSGRNGFLPRDDAVTGGARHIYRIEDDILYLTSDPELLAIATPRTMAKWRRMGVGPPFMKFSRRILYLGRDINEWLDRLRVEPLAG